MKFFFIIKDTFLEKGNHKPIEKMFSFLYKLSYERSRALYCMIVMCGSRGGGRGSGPPEKSQKYRVFVSNIGPDPL